MNREVVPLIVGILAPIILVSLIVLYLSGYDFTIYFRRINIVYYFLVFPFALGLLAAILWYRKPRN
jgi:hypothetical protein